MRQALHAIAAPPRLPTEVLLGSLSLRRPPGAPPRAPGRAARGGPAWEGSSRCGRSRRSAPRRGDHMSAADPAFWNEAAEQAVLSAMLLDRDAVLKAAELLDDTMFYREAHRILFRAMVALAERGSSVDPVTLQAALDGKLDQVGGMEYIGTLIDVVPTVNHLPHHAGIVRDRALRREIALAAVALADPTLGPEQLKVALETFQKSHRAFAAGGATDGAATADGRSPLLRSLAELLTDPDALKPPEAVVPRLAYRGRVALIAGREKLSGKSTLLTAGAAAVTRGTDFLGERCAAGQVLWV